MEKLRVAEKRIVEIEGECRQKSEDFVAANNEVIHVYYILTCNLVETEVSK